ncbi:MAG: hypothetical protein WBW34_00140 [Nitrososphaeraceae archaeon]
MMIDKSNKSFEKTLEILQDNFGSNNQELIDSALRLLKEAEASSGNYEMGIDLI